MPFKSKLYTHIFTFIIIHGFFTIPGKQASIDFITPDLAVRTGKKVKIVCKMSGEPPPKVFSLSLPFPFSSESFDPIKIILISLIQDNMVQRWKINNEKPFEVRIRLLEVISTLK